MSQSEVNMNHPLVSIIVPVKNFNPHLEECITYCNKLDYPDFEIIILPDNPISMKKHGKDIKVIPTGPIGPSEKRDIAIDYAKGKILAFIDDDAYPAQDWLKNAVKYFNDPEIAAVGGPAVTPESDSFMQKASGLVYSSFLCSGNLTFRYTPGKQRKVDDYPSCNFIVRKTIMEKLGGFETKFWPGEDTKICLEITNHLHKKIIYAPDVLVYHHRRPLFIPHLRQVASYALHRGYFVKKFPETSLRLSYLLPSLFTAGLFFGWLPGLIHPAFKIIYLSIVSVYLLAALLTGLMSRNPLIALIIFSGIILTHISYGVWFIKGLLSRKLAEENELTGAQSVGEL